MTTRAHTVGRLGIALLVAAAAAVVLLGRPSRRAAGEAIAAEPAAKAASATWERPRFTERREERLDMVRRQIEHRRGERSEVTDPAVLEAMRNVPRHEFVPPELQPRAYDDTPLPIGHGQTISQPYIVAYMTQALRLKPSDKVLEIGTGSGYQAAVLSEITPHVFSIEIVRDLGEKAQERLARLGYKTVQCKVGDGYLGWPEHAPFDAIIVTCAPESIPAPLLEQLKPGGRLCIPVGATSGVQELILVTRDDKGATSREKLIPVRFVPLTRELK